MFTRYDANSSGVLEKDEWGAIRGGGAEDADKNKDNKITKEELGEWMSSRMSQGGRGGSRGRGSSEGRGDRGRGSSEGRGDRGSGRSGSRDSRSRSSQSSDSSSSAAGSYRGLNSDERLSQIEDLPDWFGDLDANRDGQVMMSEYYASWSTKKASDFGQFDLNDDGIVTPTEAIAAAQDGAVRGAGGSSRSRDRRSSRTSSSSESRSSGSRSSSKVDRYRKHAANWLEKFDTDKNGVLSTEEWSKDGFTYTTADGDGDGKVTVNELAEAMAK
ncbi:MAG: hypothetical protein CMJ59_00820 [Planctomycetaceae bacterium]|nr:hypothetical protein [Planctomycetaceae bacterium]